MVQIGQMYGRGVGVEQNSQEAVSWFEKAETAAAASAAGTENPQVRAAFEAAAGQAQNGLGYMHAHGAGMEKNYTKVSEPCPSCLFKLDSSVAVLLHPGFLLVPHA